jgi:glycosyltransferase involved in cell wall biosynthesis
VELSIVAPAFNEELNIAEFHRRAVAAAQNACPSGSFEIIIVDDGSTDESLHMLKKIAVADPSLVVVSLSRNFGHQLALAAGLSVSKGGHILTIDADLQDPPELVTEMMQIARNQDADVVFGVRRSRGGETMFKRITAALFYRLLNLMSESEIQKDAGDFRLISRRVANILADMPERFRFTRGLIGWLGFKQVAFYYDRDARYAGTTKYSLKKMVRLAIDATTGFSVRPLRLASYLGLLAACGSVIGLGYALASWVFNDTVAGWTSVLSAVFLVGGLQLVVLGVIGEYLGRLYIEAKARPLFLIDAVYRAEPGISNAD